MIIFVYLTSFLELYVIEMLSIQVNFGDWALVVEIGILLLRRYVVALVDIFGDSWAVIFSG